MGVERKALGAVILFAGMLGGCSSSHATTPTSPSDAGTSPDPAKECGPDGSAGGPDTGAFAYTATCIQPAIDGGFPSCAQWAESADGDWTPFADTCASNAGSITTTPCSEAGVSGVCTYPATCTTQSMVFYYGAAAAAAGKSVCAGTAGATFGP